MFNGFNFLINNFIKLPVIRSVPLIFLTIFIYPLSVVILLLLKLFTIITVLFKKVFRNA
jgi:hypothetical protein